MTPTRARRITLPMSQFFFHVRHEATVFEDRRGGDFSDLVAAWRWAVHDARGMIAEGTLEGPIDRQWIEICDATGAVVATMPFERALSSH